MNQHIVQCREAAIALFSIYEGLRAISGRVDDETLSDLLKQIDKLKDGLQALDAEACDCHRDIADRLVPCKIHNGATFKMITASYRHGMRDTLAVIDASIKDTLKRLNAEVEKLEREESK